MNKKLLIAACIITSLILLAFALLPVIRRIPNSGTVKTIGVDVYWDDQCTKNVTDIDWGFLEPSSITNLTVYIENSGNIPVQLNMTTENWTPPEIQQYVNMTWNREAFILSHVCETVLTLSLGDPPKNMTQFTFDMLIIGTEV